MNSLCLPLILALFAAPPDTSAPSPEPVPLLRAHAHNDYEHPHPLTDALDQGFCSVEADIYLVNGQLLVGHNREDLRPERTLQQLYLDPLRERALKYHGRIFPKGPPAILLIDVKSAAGPTYAALHSVLQSYASMLTRFHDGKIETNAITAVVSGNRDRHAMETQPDRLAAYDGRLADLDSNPPADLVPLISDNWSLVFSWRGKGPFPPDQKTKLQNYVRKAHDQGRKIRFWGAPDNPGLWQELFAAGVDLINTDHLAELKHFLLQNRTAP